MSGFRVLECMAVGGSTPRPYGWSKVWSLNGWGLNGIWKSEGPLVRSLRKAYMECETIRGPCLDPKLKGSHCKDTHRKDLQLFETATWFLVLATAKWSSPRAVPALLLSYTPPN